MSYLAQVVLVDIIANVLLSTICSCLYNCKCLMSYLAQFVGVDIIANVLLSTICSC